LRRLSLRARLPRPALGLLLDLQRRQMNSAAILTFGIVAGIVWGGFVVIVVTAFRKESRKTRQE
jgi:hypothetical protein